MRPSLRHLLSKSLHIFRGVEKYDRKKIGKVGEDIACKYLIRRGYTIVTRNYSTPIGEIDIVAENGDVLVFVEVKMKRSDTYGMPYEAINLKKQRKLIRLAQLYIKNKNLYNRKARFDIVSILGRGRFKRKSIQLIKNAFYADTL